MRLGFLVLLMAFAMGPVATQAQSKNSRGPFATSRALVIGIDEYPSTQWQSLAFAVKDAQDFAKYLRGHGFEVESLYNAAATKQEILTHIHRLARRLGPDDRVLFFFAGHGHTETLGGEDWGYIVPADASDESASHISMEEIRTLSSKMGKARHQLFIMDACYGGMLGLNRRGVMRVDNQRPDYIDVITKRRARDILTAGGKNDRVRDTGPFGHSLFTGYLLKGLRDSEADLNADGFITFSELASYVIPAATDDAQTPVADHLPQHEGGEFVFRSQFPAKSPPPPQPSTSGPKSPQLPRIVPRQPPRSSVPKINWGDLAEYFDASPAHWGECHGLTGLVFELQARSSFGQFDIDFEAVRYDAGDQEIQRIRFDDRNFRKSRTTWSVGDDSQACLPVDPAPGDETLLFLKKQ